MTRMSKGRRVHHHDIDPEDLDSNYAASSLLTTKPDFDGKGGSRGHLGDIRSLKRNVVYEETFDDTDDDDIDRFGAKYRGEKRSRRELGMEASEEESESLDSVGEEREDDSSDSDDVEDELRRVEEGMDEGLDAPKLFSTSKTTLATSGRALRMHFKAYSETMEIRNRLQPLLGLANRLGNENRMGLSERREMGMRQVLLDMIPNGDKKNAPGDSASIKRVWHVMEQEHFNLMQEAQSVLDSEYIVPMGGSKAKRMKVINQSIWSQVQLAMQDKDRLLERIRRRRISGSEQMLGGEESIIFDDNDFFTVQVRDWIASMGSALAIQVDSSTNTTVLFNSTNRKKKQTEARSSKGRKLKHDTHPLLVGLCAPRRRGDGWEEDRIDDLCRSLLGGVSTRTGKCC